MSGSTKAQLANYLPDDQQGVLQLMSAVPYKELIWHWQFEDNPYGLSFDPIVIKHDKKVVGFNGAMNVELVYETKIIDAIWSCDFYVHSDFRSKGLGKRVKDQQFNSNNITMALGLSEVAAYVWKKKGCKPNEDICALRKYGKADSFKKSVFVLLQALEYIKGFPMRRIGKAYQYTVNDTLLNKDAIDSFWGKVAGSYQKIVVRNYNYLYWRYEKHPLASYQFIHAFQNGELAAIGVFRKHKNSTKFVDMVADSLDIKARLSLITGWLDVHPDCEVYNCASTDILLQKCLLAYGFHKTRDKQWFFVYSKNQDDLHPERNWFIMPGDSDGEFLEAAANYELSKNKGNIIVVEQSDALLFKDAKDEWTRLLLTSDANQLFLSWEWQYTWWETWGEALGLKLMLLKAYDGEELVGIAPLYIDNIILRGGIKVRRIQFIGNAWRKEGTVRTEYLDFIASKELSCEVCEVFLAYLLNNDSWDEFVICDLDEQTETYRKMKKYQNNRRWFMNIAEHVQGVNISVIGKFENFVKDLGRNTRLKLFNRRKYLDGLGAIKKINGSMDEVHQYLSILNAFHQKRWGKDCFSGRSLDFHKRLLGRLDKNDCCNLDRINIDGRAISILYNLRMGNTVYNIQSGFNENFDKKLSLGTLHMGFAIEEAFNDQRVTNFDMLAGKGKSEFYKSKYKGKTVDFFTLRVTRSRLLSLWFIINHVVPERIKCIIHKISFLP